MKIKENFKRFVTGTLSLTTFAMFQPAIPAYAEHKSEKFKYTMYTMYNNTELPMSLKAEWASWDGKYINRIKENTVLHISLGITGCNIQDGSEVDLSKLKHEDN